MVNFLNNVLAALELNDSLYIFKAYIRRAEARRKRGKLWDALQDINAALKLDPNSSLADQLKSQIEYEYRKIEGDLAKETCDSNSKTAQDSRNQLEPSSIKEIMNDDEANLFMGKREKTRMQIEELDTFMESLKTLAPNESQINQNPTTDTKSDDNKSMCLDLQKESRISNSYVEIQDVQDVDEDCKEFKKEIIGINAKIDNDRNSKLHGSVIQVCDVDIVDDDCLGFQNEIRCKDSNSNAKEMCHFNIDIELQKAEVLPQKSDTIKISFSPPKSSIDLETTLISIRKNIETVALYIESIDKDDLFRYLRSVNNADLHVDIIQSTEYIKGNPIFSA